MFDDPQNCNASGDMQASAFDLRPLITVRGGEIDALATRAEQVILRSGFPLYQRGYDLVRPVSHEVPASKGRMTLTAGFRPVTEPAMVDILAQVAIWQRFDARKRAEIVIDPPGKVATVLLSREGQWRLPTVAGIITTPTLRPNGTVLQGPGYDEATRLFHVQDRTLRLPDLSHSPTRDQALTSLHRLQELLVGFPLVTDIDRAVALSGILSTVMRGALPAVPLHAFRAPTAGTGKSFLVDLASAISTGRPCPVMAVAEKESETEKRLVGLLLAGFPIVCLDNCNGELGGDLLCQAVERPIVRVRALGSSDIFEIESRATIFATGNALRVRGDMTRRTIVANLDAGLERPELRTFGFDPVERVLAARGQYITDCLTIARAYLSAGMPGRLRPVASFAEWSDFIRSALVWLGCADPADSMEAAREDDPELGELREVMAFWRDGLGIGEAYTTRALAEAAEAREPTVMGEPTDQALPDLRDAFLRIAGERGLINTRRLGKWLLGREGRIVDGLRISRSGFAHGGIVRWTLTRA